MKTITVDIETIPDQRNGARQHAAERVKVPSNYSKPETIAAYIKDKAHDNWLNTALDAGYGHIFCIGVSIDGQPAEVIHPPEEMPVGLEAEKLVLTDFWGEVGRYVNSGTFWVGHNIKRFDLRWLYRRSLVHRVEWPATIDIHNLLKPYSQEVRDTMEMWTMDRNEYVKLADLLRILNITSQDGIDGSQVWPLVEAGDREPVLEHCANNVDETYEAWRVLEGLW